MSYVVVFENSAERELLKLQPSVARRLEPFILALEHTPRPASVKKLQIFDHRYRIRVGDYRVIYHIDDDAKRVIILKISHRRDAYPHPVVARRV